MSDPLFFDDEPQRSNRHNMRAINDAPKKNFLMAGTTVAALVIVAASIWAFYPSSSSQEEATLPIIRADSTPIRIKPEDPGGMNIAHQDSTIFQTFENTASEEPKKKVENLLAPQQERAAGFLSAEEPVSKEQLFAGLKPNAAAPAQEITKKPENVEIIMKDSFKNNPATNSKVISITEEVSEDKKTVNITENVEELPQETQEVAEIKSVAEKLEKTEPAAGAARVEDLPKVIPPQATKSGNFYVQLASIKDSSKTDSAWKNLQKKYNPILGTMSFRSQKADIEGKGTFYRVQAGPLTRADADKLCSEIKDRSGGCFVVSN